jgi:hypothetical protein
MGNASGLAGLLLLLGAAGAAPAHAQTTAVTSATTTTTTEGAFATLSPGNQKIAQALYDAQQANATSGTGGTTTGAKPMTLDEIAAMKQGGQGWGQVFKTMKAQGLVQERNLGQVVSRYQHQSRYSGGAVTTAGNQTVAKTHGPKSGKTGDDGDRATASSANAGGGGQSSAAAGQGNGNAYGRAGGSSGGHGGGHGK